MNPRVTIPCAYSLLKWILGLAAFAVAALVSRTGKHGQPRILRIGGVAAREFAQQKHGPAARLNSPRMGAIRAKPCRCFCHPWIVRRRHLRRIPRRLPQDHASSRSYRLLRTSFALAMRARALLTNPTNLCANSWIRSACLRRMASSGTSSPPTPIAEAPARMKFAAVI